MALFTTETFTVSYTELEVDLHSAEYLAVDVYRGFA